VKRALVKRVLLALLTLAAAACAPNAAPRDPASAGLSIVPSSSYSTVRFAAGTADAFNVQLEVYGVGVRVNAPTLCRLENAGKVVCQIGTLKTGTVFNLPASGSALAARAQFKRGIGDTVYTLQTR
jgi:hypothetical protein